MRLCVLHAGSSFPRLVALVEVLKTYSSKPEFHGIVFVRQRQVGWVRWRYSMQPLLAADVAASLAQVGSTAARMAANRLQGNRRTHCTWDTELLCVV